MKKWILAVVWGWVVVGLMVGLGVWTAADGATGGGSGAGSGATLPRLANNASVTVIVPSTGVTNTAQTAMTYLSAPTSTVEEYPLIVQLRTNQSFAVQDDAGNNLFGVRADCYSPGTSRHWEINFGSKKQGLVDQQFDIGGGADIAWRINGDINQAFFYNSSTTPKGIEYRYCNTNYFAAGTTSLLLANSYGEVHAVCLFGDFILQAQTAVPGAAAGTGGSLAASFDGSGSDLSVQITVVTGNAGTTTGTLVTYTLENAAAVMDPSITSVPVKPVFSAANANAANEIAKFYCTGTGTAVLISARAAPTANTTYVFNIFMCR